MNTFNILGTTIGRNTPTLIVAEIGVNHDGSMKRALDLVQLAADSGADAVKLQIFHADELMHDSALMASYQKKHCNDANARQMLQRYEMSDDAIEQIVCAIRLVDLIPIATPFSLTHVAVIEKLALPVVKIASPDIVNYPLLKQVAKLKRPMLLSTGASTMNELDTTADWLGDWHASYALLHCVSSYPTADRDANLCWIRELAERFDVPVGYSDHTNDEMTGALAVASGAVIVEKHLTYDRNAHGPDHAASADPEQFARFVKMIRTAERLRGSAGKRVLPTEEDVRSLSRQSLVAARPIAAGAVLREEDLAAKRPGTGIPASMLTQVVGKRIRFALAAGEMLPLDILAMAA